MMEKLKDGKNENMKDLHAGIIFSTVSRGAMM
jgi:hypothetical protein